MINLGWFWVPPILRNHHMGISLTMVYPSSPTHCLSMRQWSARLSSAHSPPRAVLSPCPRHLESHDAACCDPKITRHEQTMTSTFTRGSLHSLPMSRYLVRNNEPHQLEVQMTITIWMTITGWWFLCRCKQITVLNQPTNPIFWGAKQQVFKTTNPTTMSLCDHML